MELSDLLSDDIFDFCSSEPAFDVNDHDIDQLFLAAFEQTQELGTEQSPATQSHVRAPTLQQPHTTRKPHPSRGPETTQPFKLDATRAHTATLEPTPTPLASAQPHPCRAPEPHTPTFNQPLPRRAAYARNQPHPSSLISNSISHNQPCTSSRARFAPPITEEDITKRRLDAVPEKTTADTKYCVSVQEDWQKYRQEVYGSSIPSLSAITTSDLQHWMIRFVLEARKKDGSEYPPETLHHICSGIVRHLRNNGHPTLDIYGSSNFVDFRRTLDAEMKRLQQKGLGSKKQQAEPITEQEEELLWSKGLLGEDSPQVLLNTMVYMIGLYFALRSGKEHRELRFSPSQIELVERDGERPYLLYTEDQSKNHPSGLKGRRIKRKSVKHHANLKNPSRCFVHLFTLYKSRCPSNPKRNAFYLQPLKKPTAQCWYMREPLGHNKLAKIVSDMCRSAGIQGYRTNHSLRATSATRLYSAGMDEQLIMERTGHRSIDGVRSYKRTSDEQEQNVSDVLHRCKKTRDVGNRPLFPSEPTNPCLSAPVTKDLPEFSPSVTSTSVSQSDSQPVPSLPLRLSSASYSRHMELQCDSHVEQSCVSSATATATNLPPGAFYFNSCNSVVININK